MSHASDEIASQPECWRAALRVGSGHPAGTMVNGLLARFPELASVGEPDRPGVVHRLDAGTSGLLVVARTDAAYRDLVRKLKARSVERHYLALVVGQPCLVFNVPAERLEERSDEINSGLCFRALLR